MSYSCHQVQLRLYACPKVSVQGLEGLKMNDSDYVAVGRSNGSTFHLSPEQVSFEGEMEWAVVGVASAIAFAYGSVH